MRPDGGPRARIARHTAMTSAQTPTHGQPHHWSQSRPKIRPIRLALSWLVAAAALLVAAWLVPGATVNGFGGALAAAAAIARAERDRCRRSSPRCGCRSCCSWASCSILSLDALMLLAADSADRRRPPGRLVLVGARRRPRRRGGRRRPRRHPRHERRRHVHAARDPAHRAPLRRADASPTRRGSSSSRSTGSRCRCCGARCATGTRRRWRAGSPRARTGWSSGRPTSPRRPAPARPGSCSARTTTSRRSAGSRRRRGRLMACSAPADCAEIERRHATGRRPARSNGGASRGNLLSGEADDVILTVSRMDAEKTREPRLPRLLRERVQRDAGRSCCSSGRSCSSGRPPAQAKRRDVRPRGHRGGIYPFLRAAMCVVVRDLIVYGVLTDMMKGRPAVYATFSSYDEVAHHSGLERADTLEALRKLDQQFGRIERAAPLRGPAVRDRRALRPRPDAGRDVQAAERLRARRARRALARARQRRRRRGRRRADSDGRPRRRRGDRRHGEEEARPRTTSPTATWSSSARATSASST